MVEVRFETLASIEHIDKEKVSPYTAREADGLLPCHRGRRIIERADGKGKHIVMKIWSQSSHPSGRPQCYINTISSDSATLMWGDPGIDDQFVPRFGDTGVLYLDVFGGHSFLWGQFEIRTIFTCTAINRFFKYSINVNKIRNAAPLEKHTPANKRTIECITSVRDNKRLRL
jgi:hypothetical protein